MLSDLSTLQWKNRIILVNEVDNKDAVLTLMEQNEAAIDERDIVWFIMQKQTVSSNFKGIIADDFLSNTRKNFKLSEGKVTLIGKDGGIKSTRDSADLEAIFLEIDAMPVRQIEMQSQ